MHHIQKLLSRLESLLYVLPTNLQVRGSAGRLVWEHSVVFFINGLLVSALGARKALKHRLSTQKKVT